MHIYTIIGSEISYIGGNFKNDKPLLAANKAGKTLFKKLEDVKYVKYKNKKSIKFILKNKKDKKNYCYEVLKKKNKKEFNYEIKECVLSKNQLKKYIGGVYSDSEKSESTGASEASRASGASESSRASGASTPYQNNSDASSSTQSSHFPGTHAPPNSIQGVSPSPPLSPSPSPSPSPASSRPSSLPSELRYLPRDQLTRVRTTSNSPGGWMPKPPLEWENTSPSSSVSSRQTSREGSREGSESAPSRSQSPGVVPPPYDLRFKPYGGSTYKYFNNQDKKHKTSEKKNIKNNS